MASTPGPAFHMHRPTDGELGSHRHGADVVTEVPIPQGLLAAERKAGTSSVRPSPDVARKLVAEDLCSGCHTRYGWFLAETSTPSQDDFVRIGDIEMSERDLDCQLCDFLCELASEAADLAGLPGAPRFGMYSLHRSKLSCTFLETKEQIWPLNHDPPVFYIAPLFSFGPKARDWALRYDSCFMPLAIAEPEDDVAQELLPQAKLDVVRQWVQHCNLCHTHEDCNASGLKQPHAAFIVIDCETRDLVVLQAQTPYVTLSYVWGPDPAQVSGNSGRLPDSLPKLIEDAIAVTMSLGYRFLWIDRYCINKTTKATLIRHMDRVYAESSLTIIASASNDPSQGLIGVGRDRDQLPRVLHMADLRLSQIPTRLAHEVQTSKWNTRAWTYQEGFLSNRRLVFTQSQCYFECGEMSCTEALDLPLDQLAKLNTDQSRIDRVFPWVADKRPPALSPNLGSRRDQAEAYFVERVREYMKRDLTYESDALDAFAGVLNYLAGELDYLEHFATEYLVGNILGLPVWIPRSRWSTVGCAHEALLYSLTWSISRPSDEDAGTSKQVMWHTSPNVDNSYRSFLGRNLARRRHEFPSWTWCGWKYPSLSSGKIGWKPFKTVDGALPLPVELAIEHENGEVVPWPRLSDPATLLANAKASHNKLSYIRVKGMLSELVIPAHCWHANYDGECQCGPYRLRRRDVQYLSTAADRRGLEFTERGCVLTVWFCHALVFDTSEDNCRTEVMVLVPTSTAGTYERLDAMCQIKMEYFLTRPSVDIMATRFEWRLADFGIG